MCLCVTGQGRFHGQSNLACPSRDSEEHVAGIECIRAMLNSMIMVCPLFLTMLDDGFLLLLFNVLKVSKNDYMNVRVIQGFFFFKGNNLI